MSHTPGPWEYTELLADGALITRTGRFEIRTDNYDVCAYIPGSAPIRNEDDARLISAAPELLEACKKALARFYEMDDEISQPSRFYEKLEDAIAKAEGKP